MTDYLKGNYKLPATPQAAPTSAKDASSGMSAFEAEALQKLGGSIAFIKKSGKFVWTGGKQDEPRPGTRG
jgi:hypothetical protein